MNDVGLGLHSKSIIMASNSTKENIFLSMYGLGILITLPPPPKQKKKHIIFFFSFGFFLGFDDLIWLGSHLQACEQDFRIPKSTLLARLYFAGSEMFQKA